MPLGFSGGDQVRVAVEVVVFTTAKSRGGESGSERQMEAC